MKETITVNNIDYEICYNNNIVSINDLEIGDIHELIYLANKISDMVEAITDDPSTAIDTECNIKGFTIKYADKNIKVNNKPFGGISELRYFYNKLIDFIKGNTDEI